MLDGKQTQFGRYTNHSDEPNTEIEVLQWSPGGLPILAALKANSDIQQDEEITADYRQFVGMYPEKYHPTIINNIPGYYEFVDDSQSQPQSLFIEDDEEGDGDLEPDIDP